VGGDAGSTEKAESPRRRFPAIPSGKKCESVTIGRFSMAQFGVYDPRQPGEQLGACQAPQTESGKVLPQFA
jgi:hypothetical protein